MEGKDESCSTQEYQQGASIGAGPDQSYKPYIGVKLIQAYPCSKSVEGADIPGYNVKYADGYESWSPKDVFEAAYFGISVDNSLTPPDVERFMGDVTSTRIDDKTCLVRAEHLTGFLQYETASCVAPENYDEEIGKTIAMKEIRDRLWFALGFVLQWAKYGLKKVEKRPIQ